MGICQREADGAVEAGFGRCSGAEAENRGHAAAGKGTTENQRNTRRT